MTYSIGLTTVAKDELYYVVADRIMKQAGQNYSFEQVGLVANAVALAAGSINAQFINGTVSGSGSSTGVSLSISLSAAVPMPQPAPVATLKPTTLKDITEAGESKADPIGSGG